MNSLVQSQDDICTVLESLGIDPRRKRLYVHKHAGTALSEHKARVAKHDAQPICTQCANAGYAAYCTVPRGKSSCTRCGEKRPRMDCSLRADVHATAVPCLAVLQQAYHRLQLQKDSLCDELLRQAEDLAYTARQACEQIKLQSAASVSGKRRSGQADLPENQARPKRRRTTRANCA
ncbi:hypothetical protein C8T65DRAFT_144409 [Cerioporus squamosus]|nr:hypothetical protein C8T65DRAFT_144409 [Cerioporus squamosus]